MTWRKNRNDMRRATMTQVERLTQFVQRIQFEDFTPQILDALKLRVLDSIGCAAAAVDGPPVKLIRNYIEQFPQSGSCTLVTGGTASPMHAALYNGACLRYID